MNSLKTMITKAAEKHNLDPAIVYGICKQESLCEPFAVRYEPDYRWLHKPESMRPRICSLETEKTLQKMSFGLMQVMGAVYREYGLAGWLSLVMADPEVQLEYGCKHLARLIKRWGEKEGILAYNAGSPRKNTNGKYVNAYYLEKVLRYAGEFAGLAD